MGSVLTMFGLITGGTQNALAQLDVPFTTDLTGISWCLDVDCDADNEYCQCQIGFSSTFNSANDSRSVVDTIIMRFALTTSGVYMPFQNVYRPLPDLQVMGGERLYLNVVGNAGNIGQVWAHLNISGDLDKPSSRRR